MPPTQVVFYAGRSGRSPILKWLDGLPDKAQNKAVVRIERLAEKGHELRRPEADFLRDNILELRIAHQRVQYRILYFFHEGVAVLAHGLQKENEVPDSDIARASRRRERFVRDPTAHTLADKRR